MFNQKKKLVLFSTKKLSRVFNTDISTLYTLIYCLFFLNQQFIIQDIKIVYSNYIVVMYIHK